MPLLKDAHVCNHNQYIQGLHRHNPRVHISRSFDDSMLSRVHMCDHLTSAFMHAHARTPTCATANVSARVGQATRPASVDPEPRTPRLIQHGSACHHAICNACLSMDVPAGAQWLNGRRQTHADERVRHFVKGTPRAALARRHTCTSCNTKKTVATTSSVHWHTIQPRQAF